MKFVSDIAVNQQTRTCDQTFEGVVDSNHPPVPGVQPRPYLVHIWPNFVKSHQFAQNGCSTCSLWSPELVYEVSSRLKTKWLSNEAKTTCPYLGIRSKFDRFLPINSSNLNIFELYQFCMKKSINYIFSVIYSLILVEM